jgi:hypothetical protein
LHRLVAHKIVELFASVAEAQPELIARHWANANETEPAIAAWRKAGDAAFLRYACKEAEASYRHALDLLRTLPESRERAERELELLNRFVPALQLTRGGGRQRPPKRPPTLEHSRKKRKIPGKSCCNWLARSLVPSAAVTCHQLARSHLRSLISQRAKVVPRYWDWGV